MLRAASVFIGFSRSGVGVHPQSKFQRFTLKNLVSVTNQQHAVAVPFIIDARRGLLERQSAYLGIAHLHASRDRPGRAVVKIQTNQYPTDR